MPDTLMVGVSGIRGIVGKDLTPELVARYAAAFGTWTRTGGMRRPRIVLGRDARTSARCSRRRRRLASSRSGVT